jgi:hypothetical protein
VPRTRIQYVVLRHEEYVRSVAAGTRAKRYSCPLLRGASSDRVAQHCHLTLLRGRDRFELHRRAAGAFEEADAVADEDRGDVHDDLVE